MCLLVFSGCKSLYGKYERPDVNTQGLYRDPVSLTDTLAVADTTSFGNMPWRTVFTDPTLQNLIQTALDNNVNMLNAALNVKMVEEALKCARLAFLPSLTSWTILLPDSLAISSFFSSTASDVAHPVRLRPSVSVRQAIVLAVKSPEQLPCPGHAAHSMVLT